MARKLPSRPDLDYLRKHAKALLKTKTTAERKTFRLADAQLQVARDAGFAAWPALKRHVDDLRGLEGEWHFASLEVDGNAMPAAIATSMRILIDGDRFRSESAEATYDGTFVIDVDARPKRIDIEFVAGPEAGNRSYGIYELNGDRLTLCLGLVGSDRPATFATSRGSGHALEQLRRADASRPSGVTGGRREAAASASPDRESDAAPAADSSAADRTAFDGPLTPLLKKLQGEWAAVSLDRDGEPMPDQWLPFGSRVTTGNETTVTFGGQTMVHAKMRIDESASPMTVDYLNLTGPSKGKISPGMMRWDGDEVTFAIGVPGKPRPENFDAGSGRTVSRWRRKS